jgi:hypothetical protein
MRSRRERTPEQRVRRTTLTKGNMVANLPAKEQKYNPSSEVRSFRYPQVAVNKREPLGENRLHTHPPGVALAGSATLNRLELGNQKQDRTHKIQYEPAEIEECLLAMGVRCLAKHAREIVIDLDGMGHLVHGMQEGRHFNAYYDGYCYLPLYAFVGSVPL